ncbi:MAG: hypothetical protein QOE23_1250 [Pseudonocardiales bacterium]|jgi:hypothetical protein|nr:hypothetical protein [Pseudonocardiales bacterium]
MRYADYMPPDESHWAVEPGHLGEDEGPSIVIAYSRLKGSWVAVWGDRKLIEEFRGTREQVIAWARERCETILTYNADDELVALGPDDQ